MKTILPLTYSRCRGEDIGEHWGHPDRVCNMREHCKRYIQSILEFNNVPADARYVGWSCATDDKEDLIPLEQQMGMFES